ncbi:MAG TPA: helix-turn-helix domain-containing protein [Candidatus Binatia bacterium]
MKPETAANIVGAFALAICDGIREAVDGRAGSQAAAALVHLSKYGDEPIDALRRPLRLSHPGCVRLVDRLEEQKLVVRGAGEDRRARPLRLTPAGASAARTVLRRREAALRRALAALTPREQQTLGRLAAKALAALIEDEAQALTVCRLCDYGACPDDDCPAAKALTT